MSRIFPRGFILHPAARRKRNLCNGGDRCRFGPAPWPDIVWLDLPQPSDTLTGTIIEIGHSRFPAAKGSLDDIMGLVDLRSAAAQCLAGNPIDLRSLSARRRGDEGASEVAV